MANGFQWLMTALAVLLLASATVVCQLDDIMLASPFTDIVDLAGDLATVAVLDGEFESSKIVTGPELTSDTCMLA